MPGGQIYGVVDEPKRERGPLRKVLVPLLMLLMLFYVVLFLQQLAVLLAAKAFGSASIMLHVGLGANQGESDLFGMRLVRGSDWWWGPQVVARALPSSLGQTVVEYAGPAVSLLLLILIGIDLRRSRTILHAMVLAACVAALLVYFALPAIYPAIYR
jgi:hypothetical protein